MFDTSHITPPFASRGRVQALETWREAADLVRIRGARPTWPRCRRPPSPLEEAERHPRGISLTQAGELFL
jgi:hypothetical protein